MVLKELQQENAAYYLQRKRELAGALLLTPAGSLCRRLVHGREFWYLRQYAGGNRRRELYLGRAGEPLLEAVRGRQQRRPKLLGDLSQAKQALRVLGYKEAEVNREELNPTLKKLIAALDREGLWDAGMELVGSWCFKVYQNYLGVEFFPFRTVDIDLAVRLPYEGGKKDVGALLKSLGFEERFNVADGTISYHGGEFMVEFIRARKGSGARAQRPQVPGLGLAPVPVAYLDLLLDNPLTLQLKGVGKVTVPHPAAFFLHKLLVAAARREPAKREKDFRQAAATAKAVAMDEAMLAAAQGIWQGLPKAWQRRIGQSLKQAQAVLEADAAPALDLWRLLAGA
ncbi:MAG: GSU2403 family nucleotidyltransferase fold protein [Thermodesulfobacteriota bacterium]